MVLLHESRREGSDIRTPEPSKETRKSALVWHSFADFSGHFFSCLGGSDFVSVRSESVHLSLADAQPDVAEKLELNSIISNCKSKELLPTPLFGALVDLSTRGKFSAGFGAFCPLIKLAETQRNDALNVPIHDCFYPSISPQIFGGESAISEDENATEVRR